MLTMHRAACTCNCCLPLLPPLQLTQLPAPPVHIPIHIGAACLPAPTPAKVVSNQQQPTTIRGAPHPPACAWRATWRAPSCSCAPTPPPPPAAAARAARTCGGVGRGWPLYFQPSALRGALQGPWPPQHSAPPPVAVIPPALHGPAKDPDRPAPPRPAPPRPAPPRPARAPLGRHLALWPLLAQAGVELAQGVDLRGARRAGGRRGPPCADRLKGRHVSSAPLLCRCTLAPPRHAWQPSGSNGAGASWTPAPAHRLQPAAHPARRCARRRRTSSGVSRVCPGRSYSFFSFLGFSAAAAAAALLPPAASFLAAAAATAAPLPPSPGSAFLGGLGGLAPDAGSCAAGTAGPGARIVPLALPPAPCSTEGARKAAAPF